MDLRTWVSGPQREVSGPGFQALGIWLSGPGFQDLESSPSYGRLIFFPSLFSASTVTFLCVQWSQTDARTDVVKIGGRTVSHAISDATFYGVIGGRTVSCIIFATTFYGVMGGCMHDIARNLCYNFL
jgi:hypothetical protein